jgi:hypothetical protein
MMLYFVDIGIYIDFIEQPRPLFPDERWLSKATGREICPRCKCVDRSHHPAPVEIILENKPDDEMGGLVETTGITVWNKKFIEKLARFQPRLAVGRCSLRGGKIIDEYVTCYTKRCITIRGNKQSKYQICPQCGTIISNVEPGPKYVLEKDLDDSDLYQDAFCHFYVTEKVVDNFRDYSQNISFKAISVRQNPADGHPVDLSQI